MSRATMRKEYYPWLNKPKRYVGQAAQMGDTLITQSLVRQFKTAQEILDRFARQKGLLLADDVGLGKTTIGVLVAWTMASMGKRVRVLAPNKTVAEGWRKSLKRHRRILGVWKESMPFMVGVDEARERLNARRIWVGTHGEYKQRPCDLLIVDEAHRSKGDGKRSARQVQHARMRLKEMIRAARSKDDKMCVLFLTATPFGIRIEELCGMLSLLGVPPATVRQVERFNRLTQEYWTEELKDDGVRDAAESLIAQRDSCIRGLKPFVIRHVIEDLDEQERVSFGEIEKPVVTSAAILPETLEVIVRADRLFRLAGGMDFESQDLDLSMITNDPRNHVGWLNLKVNCQALSKALENSPVPQEDELLLKQHISKILQLTTPPHPKIQHLCDQVAMMPRSEKALIFCHHHSTAVEVTHALANALPPRPIVPAKWRSAWIKVFEKELRGQGNRQSMAKVFVDWLCKPFLVQQILDWADESANSADGWKQLFENTPCGPDVKEKQPEERSVAQAARDLFETLLDRPDGRTTAMYSLMRQIANGKSDIKLPDERIMCLANFPKHFPVGLKGHLQNRNVFFEVDRPDLFMEIFNSPFGPDILIVTDRLSEGVDLHGYCRHLIHYEMPYSPVRVIQRNGRLRRLNSWAARTKQKIMIYYPQLPQTRDEALVNIVGKRLDCFNMLLGGVGAPIDLATVGRISNTKERSEQLNRAARSSDAISLSII